MVKFWVDPAIYKKSLKGRVFYCHLIAPTLAEMHSVAEILGVRRHFFHNARYPHYDLTSIQREHAIVQGAIAVSSVELVKIAKSFGFGSVK